MRARRKTGETSDQRQNAPHSVHAHAAFRMRERRIELGISQLKLAAALGIAYQQLSKYEKGKNRISAGRLYELAKVLGVPITFFFEGVDTSTAAAPPAGGDTEDLGTREAAELVAAYRAISNPAVRRWLRQLARALGPEPNGSTALKPPPTQSRRPSRRARTDQGRVAER